LINLQNIANTAFKIEKGKALDTNKIGGGQFSYIREKPNYIIPGFSYSIIESFYNDHFNMVYTQKRSDKEIKLRQDYYNLAKMNLTKMTKEEKLDIRRQKKEIKEKLNDEEKKRIELITKPPIKHKLFRVKSAVGKVPIINVIAPFTLLEIYLAKKCMVKYFHE
jgi:hypothetical protein